MEILLTGLPEESGTMYVPSSDVGTDHMTSILVLNADGGGLERVV